MDRDGWDLKRVWRKRGKDSFIEISCHRSEPSKMFPDIFMDREGPFRWAVYAYVYPKHPHFLKFDKEGGMMQEAAGMMPLHCGASFFRAHFDEDFQITSYQVGADYHHLHDDRFTNMETPEEAFEVFNDADRLLEWLDRMTEKTEAVNEENTQ